MRKGVDLRKYVYKPYHSWRHGHRREKIRTFLVFVLKSILAIGGVWLSVCYIDQHTEVRITERAVTSGIHSDESVYGIGFEPEKGELFWFHKKTEIRNNET